jgi:phage terminase large subunit GpA-like protein
MMHARLPKGLPNAWQLSCANFAEAIRPDPILTVAQWADRHRVLSSDISKEPGPWRTDRVPYSREIMEVLTPSDPTQEVTFVKGTQVAGTEIGNNFLGYIIDWAPGPVMMVMPTSNTGKRASRTRLSRMIESSPGLREKISDHARDRSNTATMKDFPGGVLVIAGANSAAELKSMPVRYLFEDEIDEYPDDVDGQGPSDELAEKRTDTYSYRRKIYRPSTPTAKESSKVWKHWLRSDQRKYYVPCPHCAHEQVLEWEQFRWTTRKTWEIVRHDDGEIVEVPAGTEGATERDTGELTDVWYECEACAARIDEHHKSEMLPRGRWIKGNPASSRAGFHLPSFYSPLGWYSWFTAVEKRLEADKDPTGILLKTWTNTVLAEPYVDLGEQISEFDLKGRAENYRIGTVPMGGLLVAASVDVQSNRLEAKVKAFGRGEESWLVDYQVIHGDTETAQPWTVLDEYLKKQFPHECGATLRISACAVDAGYRTQTVYAFCRPRAHRHIFPVRGQSQSGKSVLGRPSSQDIDHNGQKIPGGIQLWPVGSDTAKSKIYARLKITQPGPGCIHFPLGLPDEYFKQLTAERLISRYVRGYVKRVWEKDAGARNEALDLEVYAYAAAIYYGLARAPWDQMEATLRAASQDLFVKAQSDAQSADAAAEAGAPGAPVKTSAPARSGGGGVPKSNFINRWKN